MTVVRRTNRDLSDSLLGGDGGESLVRPAVLQIESRWPISHRAIQQQAARAAGTGSIDGVVFSWNLRIEEHGGAWAMLAARACIQQADGSTLPLRDFGSSGRGVQVRIHHDPPTSTLDIELTEDNQRLVALCFVLAPSPLPRSGGARPCKTAYASTPLLNIAAPGGLGIGGGRYEFEGVFVTTQGS